MNYAYRRNLADVICNEEHCVLADGYSPTRLSRETDESDSRQTNNSDGNHLESGLTG